jgi:hypothetical protein
MNKLIAGFLFFVMGSVHAGAVTWDDLRTMPRPQAMMYVWGIVDAESVHRLNSLRIPKETVCFLACPSYACVPVAVTSGQAFQVVEDYMKSRTNEWHEEVVPLVRSALMTAFPCKGA